MWIWNWHWFSQVSERYCGLVVSVLFLKTYADMWVNESHSVMSISLWPHGLYSPWNSLGQNTGVSSRVLLQGIFSTQGSNPGLPHCRQILYHLSHQRSPNICADIFTCKFDSVNRLHSNDNRKKWIAVLYIFIFIYIYKTLIMHTAIHFAFFTNFFLYSNNFIIKCWEKTLSLKSQRRAHSKYVQKLNYKTKKHFVNFYFC